MIETGWRRKRMIAAKVFALVPAFLIGLPAQWLALHLAPSLARWLPVYFHRYVLAVLNVRVSVTGAVDPRRPLLITANHLSWLDILVISSLFPVSFIAKSEVGEWPLFGTLARLQRSIFVERQKRGKTGEVSRKIAERQKALATWMDKIAAKCRIQQKLETKEHSVDKYLEQLNNKKFHV